MKLPKALPLIPLAFGSIISVSAQEYKFDNFKFDQVESPQNTYQPKDKLDEYIIKGANYSTKFVPLMNDGSDGSEYKDLMAKDAKKLLVDTGFDFVNDTANSEIQNRLSDIFRELTLDDYQKNGAYSIQKITKNKLSKDD